MTDLAPGGKAPEITLPRDGGTPCLCPILQAKK